MQKVALLRMMNKIVKVIRDNHEVSFTKVCYECEIAPSTLYQYKDLILEMFSDIKFRDKKFFVE